MLSRSILFASLAVVTAPSIWLEAMDSSIMEPVESVILERQSGYYAAIAESNYRGSCEVFVEFMLEVIRDAMRPYAFGADENEIRRERALVFLLSDGGATVEGLAEHLGCSKRTAERIVADLKADGRITREGSARGGRWVSGDADAS